jgi:hypothetical protein
MIVMEKICRGCGVFKQITEFYKSKGGKNGLNSKCKTCEYKNNSNYFRTVKENNNNINPYTDLTKTKICSKCNIEKLIINFGKNASRHGGLENRCKNCTDMRRKNIIKNNKNVNPHLDKSKNKICIICKINQSVINFYINNSKIDCLDINCIFCKKNLEKRDKNTRNKYYRNRLKTDPIYWLHKQFTKHIQSSFKKNNSSKNRTSCLDYIQYTIEELKLYLETQFEPWMNWNNHGVYNRKTWDDNDLSTWKWQLDHIIPHSEFQYSSMEDENFKKCWAFKNLQPLSAKENNLKRNKLKYFKPNGEFVDNTELYNKLFNR